MTFTTLIMKHPHTEQIRKAPVGVSWASLFVGPFVPLVRGHYSGAFLWIFPYFLTGGVGPIVQMFIYNKKYLTYLINNGYQVKYSPVSVEYVASKLKMSLPVISEE